MIHLGPAGYFMQNNFQIRAGDTLEVTGVKVVEDQVPVIAGPGSEKPAAAA